MKTKALLIAAAIAVLPITALCADDGDPSLSDVLENADLLFRYDTPEFASALDERAWETLAGVYIKDGPPAAVGNLELCNTIWGMDYVDFGPDTLEVSYWDGEWYFKGAGVTEVMQLDSISADGKTFYTINDWYPLTFKIEGDYLYLVEYGERFYKATGPDCYLRFLKSYMEEQEL